MTTYGTCGQCGRDFVIKKNGALRWHTTGVQVGYGLPAPMCPGADTEPVQAAGPCTAFGKS